MKHDFGIEWQIPEGQLIPAVTNRANYIHWLQDLLNLASPPGILFCTKSYNFQSSSAAHFVSMTQAINVLRNLLNSKKVSCFFTQKANTVCLPTSRIRKGKIMMSVFVVVEMRDCCRGADLRVGHWLWCKFDLLPAWGSNVRLENGGVGHHCGSGISSKSQCYSKS